MKILLFLLVSISAFSQDSLSSIGIPNNATLRISGIGFSKPDCERNESITEWNAENKGNEDCAHGWIYAEYEDLNKKSNIVNAVYCECGCPYTEHEARICEQCKRHETRVKSISYSLKVKKSKYMQLLESLKN